MVRKSLPMTAEEPWSHSGLISARFPMNLPHPTHALYHRRVRFRRGFLGLVLSSSLSTERYLPGHNFIRISAHDAECIWFVRGTRTGVVVFIHGRLPFSRAKGS